MDDEVQYEESTERKAGKGEIMTRTMAAAATAFVLGGRAKLHCHDGMRIRGGGFLAMTAAATGALFTFRFGRDFNAQERSLLGCRRATAAGAIRTRFATAMMVRRGLGLNDGDAEVHGGFTPFPITAAGAAVEGEGFAEQLGFGGNRGSETFGEFRGFAVHLLVNDHSEVQRELGGRVTAAAMDAGQLVKAYATDVAAEVEQDRVVGGVGGDAGELQQTGCG